MSYAGLGQAAPLAPWMATVLDEPRCRSIPPPADCWRCGPGLVLQSQGVGLPPRCGQQSQLLTPPTQQPIASGIAPVPPFFTIGAAIFGSDPRGAISRITNATDGLISYAKIAAIGMFIGVPLAAVAGYALGATLMHKKMAKNRRRKRRGPASLRRPQLQRYYRSLANAEQALGSLTIGQMTDLLLDRHRDLRDSNEARKIARSYSRDRATWPGRWRSQ